VSSFKATRIHATTSSFVAASACGGSDLWRFRVESEARLVAGDHQGHGVLLAHGDRQDRKDQSGHRGHPDRRDPLALTPQRLSTPW
jgi:hypothetical protein